MLAKAASLLALLPLLVLGLPAPQQSPSAVSCDPDCTAVLTAANACSDLPAVQQGSCLCSSSGFLPTAESCYACNGGTIFTESGLYYIGEAIEGCGGATSTISRASTASAASTTSGSASSSGAATIVIDGIPVTEDPTQPISFAAWAPSGFSPSLSYHIAATGGPNTTIAAVETVTVTTLSQTVTATVTVGFILDATQIVQIAGNDGYDDYTFCKIVNETSGDCIELQFDGTSLTASSEFTLAGATSTWIAFAPPTGSPVVASPTSSRLSGTSSNQGSASSSAAVGTLGGVAPSSASSA